MTPLRFEIFKEVHQITEHNTTYDNIGNILDVEEVYGSLVIEYEIYAINPDGKFIRNPKIFMNLNGMEYGESENKEIKTRLCNATEIILIDKVGKLEFCWQHNKNEVDRLSNERNRFLRLTEASIAKTEVDKIINSIDKLILVFEDWCHNNGFPFPALSKEDIDSKNLIGEDQDSLIDKFKAQCIERTLIKGKTIKKNTLYDIGVSLKLPLPERDKFKAGEKYYQELREYASRTGYSKKRNSMK